MIVMTEGIDKKNILIITGGNVDKDFAALWIKKNHFDYCIAADRGGMSAYEMGIHIDHLIGDFDSIDSNISDFVKGLAGKVTQLNPEKDATDTELAIDAAAALRPLSICIIGATGDRADHTFTTLMSIVRAKQKGIDIFAVDKNNKIYAADGDVYIKRNEQFGDYVSLAVISDSAEITLHGMKYGLEGEIVKRGTSLCQSNEIVGEEAHIRIRNGIALVFESRDED